MNLEDVIENFGRRLELGTGSLFLGAGMSVYAGLPSWSQLVEPLSAQLGIPPQSDALAIADYFEAEFGNEALLKHLQDSIGKVGPPAEPSVFHQTIGELPLKSIWTTNYDCLIEHFNPGVVRVLDQDEQLARRAETAASIVPLYKMHGSTPVDGPPVGIVLSRNHYDRYERTHPRFWTVLQSEFLTGSFLFAGFSFDDPNVRLLFKIIRLLDDPRRAEHYAVLRRPEQADQRSLFDLQVKEFESLGIGVVPISDFEEYDTLAKGLAVRSRSARVFISGSAPQGRDFECHSGDLGPSPGSLVSFCERLGQELAKTGVRLVAASELGAAVGYELLRQLVNDNSYDPDRFLLVRRSQDKPVDAPSQRLGKIEFYGSSPDVMRSHTFSSVRPRAVVAIGGGSGTRKELSTADELGLGVIPVGRTGGAALEKWTAMEPLVSDGLLLGGRPIDPATFARLNHNDAATAARATVSLIKQALFDFAD